MKRPSTALEKLCFVLLHGYTNGNWPEVLHVETGFYRQLMLEQGWSFEPLGRRVLTCMGVEIRPKVKT